MWNGSSAVRMLQSIITVVVGVNPGLFSRGAGVGSGQAISPERRTQGGPADSFIGILVEHAGKVGP